MRSSGGFETRLSGGRPAGRAEQPHPVAAPGLHFALDSLAMNVHGNADSHIDPLCHVIFNRTLYNGVEPGTAATGDRTALSIDVARDGIVGRGVLLDIPRVRGVSWLEPGDHVTLADLEAAERAQQVRIGTGDVVFVRVGHRRRRDELGAWDAARARAGLHPTALLLLAERGAAALGHRSTATAIGNRFPGQPHRDLVTRCWSGWQWLTRPGRARCRRRVAGRRPLWVPSCRGGRCERVPRHRARD